ncbi:MAG: hypothetical protein PHO92_04160 [Candidatus Peribacteraceae bacterium]|nr:hypothetical protein [Candidatus Peribacteraceae bacterium]
MKKILTLCALIAAAVPFIALAAFTRPSEALRLLSYDGKPRTFSAQVYVSAADTTATVSMNGAMEGKRPEDIKAKFSLTADIAERGAWLATVRAQARVYRGQLYVLLEDAAARDGMDIPSAGIGQWYVMPLAFGDMQQPEEWEDIAEELAMHLRAAGVETTAEDLTQALNAVVDGLFAMEQSRYAGGYAYSMRLHPNFLRNAVGTVSRFLLEHGNEDVRAFVREMQQEMMMEPDMLAETESQVRQMVNLHLKVDTNTADEFVFGKYYVSLAVPEGDMHVALEGKLQQLMTPVYLEIPRDAIAIEEGSGEFAEMLMELMGNTSGEFEYEWPDTSDEEEYFWQEDWEFEEQDAGRYWEEEVLPPPRIPRVPRTPDPHTRQRMNPLMPKVPGCDFEPGTREYVRMQREGVCPVVNWKYVR